MHVLMLLRDMGLDPASDPARRALNLVRDRVTWGREFDGRHFFLGEVEPCINGRVGAVGAYFGQDVRAIVKGCSAEQVPDGGWNREAANGLKRSAFNTTICVLEALLVYERASGGIPEVSEARLRGAGVPPRAPPPAPAFDRRGDRARPQGWSLLEELRLPDVVALRCATGLEYLRSAGVAPDERVAEAIDLLASKRDGDGRWPLGTRYPGVMPVEIDAGEGRPSRWNTLARVASVEVLFNDARHPDVG